jgi:hypothetical protein
VEIFFARKSENIPDTLIFEALDEQFGCIHRWIGGEGLLTSDGERLIRD